jgi:hypothetical protein
LTYEHTYSIINTVKRRTKTDIKILIADGVIGKVEKPN